MKIGINGLFLRKPGSGIGVVTRFFLESLGDVNLGTVEYTIYTDTPDAHPALGPTGRVVYIKPWWQRDDLIRKLLWEHIQLPKRALKDGVTHFLSLYQAPTELPKDIPHTMVVHDVIPEIFSEYQRNKRARLLWKLTKRGIRAAAKIVCVSNATKRDVMDSLGVAAEKIRVAYPSIHPLFFQEGNSAQERSVLEKYHLAPGYLYHGGGLELRKNTESLLRAYAEALKANALLPPLVISGYIHSPENPLATDVKGLLAHWQIEKNVKLLGFVPDEDLPALYKNAALFLFPSFYEGFGMPVLEALSQGTAVVATRNSSLEEVGGMVTYWVPELTRETLEASYQKAMQSSFEEKKDRILHAQHFQSWTIFTQKIVNTLIQY